MANQIIKGCKYDHVAIMVKDYEKSLAMYKKLGFTETLVFEGGAFLDVGDGGRAIEIFAANCETPMPHGGWMHFCLEVEDVDAALAIALEAGFTPLSPATNVTISSVPPQDVRNAFVRGNDGEVFEFVTYF